MKKVIGTIAAVVIPMTATIGLIAYCAKSIYDMLEDIMIQLDTVTVGIRALLKMNNNVSLDDLYESYREEKLASIISKEDENNG